MSWGSGLMQITKAEFWSYLLCLVVLKLSIDQTVFSKLHRYKSVGDNWLHTFLQLMYIFRVLSGSGDNNVSELYEKMRFIVVLMLFPQYDCEGKQKSKT